MASTSTAQTCDKEPDLKSLLEDGDDEALMDLDF